MIGRYVLSLGCDRSCSCEDCCVRDGKCGAGARLPLGPRRAIEVFFGARDPRSEEVRGVREAAGPTATVGTCSAAIAASEAILLAIPWDQTRLVLEQAGNLDGKIVMDCINPLTSDLSGLELGFNTSAAEQIAQWFPTARVVKAFNTLSAATMEDPQYGDQQACMFYCGDDAEAKAVVKQLAEELGFAAIDCGPLQIVAPTGTAGDAVRSSGGL